MIHGHNPSRRIPLGIASVLFFISGFAGLGYEIVWFKRFSLVWGSSALSMATVVSSFLFGLGLGAHLLGRLADRVQRPLLWYGLCEAVIGACAIGIPYEITWVQKLSASFNSFPTDHLLIDLLTRFALTLLVLAPPCMLMGGTLPLMVRQFTTRDSHLRKITGWLYGVNTVGAAAGCYLLGFHVLPAFGLFWANIMMACLNFLVAFIAIVLARSRSEFTGASVAPVLASGPRPPETPKDLLARPRHGALQLAVALTGCAALILQMVWARQLSVVLGGSTYAFSAMLFIVLVGIGAGSLLFRLWTDFAPLSNHTPTLVILFLLVTTIAGKRLIPELHYLAGSVMGLRPSQAFNGIFCVLASAVLELLPSLAMGFLFPLFIQMTRGGVRDAGHTVGSIYAMNTLGAIMGGMFTASLLIPALGTAKTISVALALYTMALMILHFADGARPFIPRVFSWIACCIAIYLAAIPNDPLLTNHGMYLYGYENPKVIHAYSEQLFFKEGRSCNVLVTQRNDGNRFLRVNGKMDASGPKSNDMLTQLGLCYFPRIIKPESRDVLVIGFGSGATSGACLLFPDTRVTCCEIEPAIIEASPYFSTFNHHPERSTNFTAVIDDARNYMQGTDQEYDIIISEPSNPWIAGIAGLYTKEFYAVVMKRLRANGMFAQWIQTYTLSDSDYRLIVRTMMSVFPHIGLIQIDPGNTLLLAGSRPLNPTFESLRTAQALIDSQPLIRADLQKYFRTDDAKSLIISSYILYDNEMKRLLDRDPETALHTDLNLRLEYDVPKRLFQSGSDTDKINKRNLSGLNTQRLFDQFRQWQGTVEHVDGLERLVNVLLNTQLTSQALTIVDFGIEIDPQRSSLLAKKLILRPPADADRFARAVDELIALSPNDARMVGAAMGSSRRYRRAITIFEKLAAIQPESATIWAHLGINYRAMGEFDNAKRADDRARVLDPFREFAQKSYGSLQGSTRNPRNAKP